MQQIEDINHRSILFEKQLASEERPEQLNLKNPYFLKNLILKLRCVSSMNQPRKTQANERAQTVMKRAPFILKTSVLEYGLIFAS